MSYKKLRELQPLDGKLETITDSHHISNWCETEAKAWADAASRLSEGADD